METKICNKCGYEKNILAFAKRSKDHRRNTCTNCRSGSNKERFYYPTLELEELSKKDIAKNQRKLDSLRQKRKYKISGRLTKPYKDKHCKQCSAIIENRKIGKYLCDTCSKTNYRANKNTRDIKGIKTISTRYIKKLLKRQINCKASEIPQELIELKRTQLKLKRYAKGNESQRCASNT